MELDEYRSKIDKINDEIIELFKERMDLSLEVAKYKKKNGLPVLDKKRESRILKEVREKCGEKYSPYCQELFSLIFKLSRDYQQEFLENSLDYGLIGEKLGHSFSKEIHEKLASYDYRLLSLPKNNLESFLKSRNFKGINVTIPYKEAVIPFCDELSERAKKIGSVNTIKQDGGILKGYNTDYDGFLSLLKYYKADVKNKNCIILGTGGASKTVRAVLEDLGAGKIYNVSRKGKINYENLYDLSNIEILINATPVGMYPHNGGCLVDLKRLPRLKFVGDLVYNPLKTELLKRAQELKINNADGLLMLVSQAKSACEIFTGEKIPDEKNLLIFKETEKKFSNLVLVGMPGSGKTTLGKTLAKLLDRQFIDTDEEIEKREGKTIAEIFNEGGEYHFRNIEEKVIKEVSKKTGAVIAAGGGALKRKSNRRNLTSNGRLCFVERDLEKLSCEGRPLSKSFDDIKRLWEERKDSYLSLSDFKSDNSGSIKDTAEDIKAKFDDLFKV